MAKLYRDKPFLNESGNIWEKIYSIVTYPISDTSQFDKVYTTIMQKYGDTCKIAYIKHNHDILENGQLKAEHYHILIQFNSQHSLPKLAKDLGNIPENYIEWKANFKDSLIYLTHRRCPEKSTYEVNEIQANFKLDSYFQVALDEETEISMLLDALEVNPIFTQLKYFAIDNHLWGTFRRNYLFLKDVANGKA